MRLPSAAKLIGANIVIDALGTALFLAGIGFFAVGLVGADPAALLDLVAFGTVAGVVVSFVAASLVDTFDARRVLLVIQAMQFAAYLGMLLTRSVQAILILCAAGAMLSRITSPVRGALPPSYLEKPELLGFKSKVKVWTVAATAVGGGAAAAFGIIHSEASLLLIPGLNCLSFVVVFAITVALPGTRKPAGPRRLVLYRPGADVLAGSLLIALLFALGCVPESAIAVLAAQHRQVPSVVVALTPVVAFVVALGGQRLLRNRSDLLSLHSRRILFGAMCTAALAIAVLAWVTRTHLGFGAVVVVILIVFVLAEAALLAAAYCMWDLQYGLGPDANRGGVIGIFTVGSSLGMALAPALASFLFFKGLGVAVVVGVLTLATALGASLNLIVPSTASTGDETARP